MLQSVVTALRARGHTFRAYVDDLAATRRLSHPSSKAAATSGRVEIAALLLSLGLHVRPENGAHAGTRALPLLEFLVDTRRRVLLLPVE